MNFLLKGNAYQTSASYFFGIKENIIQISFNVIFPDVYITSISYYIKMHKTCVVNKKNIFFIIIIILILTYYVCIDLTIFLKA